MRVALSLRMQISDMELYLGAAVPLVIAYVTRGLRGGIMTYLMISMAMIWVVRGRRTCRC